MTKIVAIIGSLRKESVNRIIFNHYKELASPHFVLEEGDISNIPLYNQDIEQEPQAVIDLAKQIKESHGVIFFSPEYNYSVPGVLKNALDWLSRNESQPFDNKKAAIIGASPGATGTARMQYHLRQIGVFLNIHFLHKPEAMIGQYQNKIGNGKIIDPETLKFLQTHIEKFSKFIN